jgi:DNA invertase Pin-like site-specific DNA recombinase
MKKAVLYGRTATPDQHLESQFIPLRDIVAQRGFELTAVYSDFGNLSRKARRPGVSALLRDARRGKFSVILVGALDRLARSTRNFLEMVHELDSLGIELISAKEAVDTGTPTGRIFVMALGCITELEKSLMRERIKSGMRRRMLEGLPVGRQRLDVDHVALVRDRLAGMSLTQVAKRYDVSRPSVVRFVREARQRDSAVFTQFRPETLQAAACAA